jgi:hypothetical protein
MDKVKSQDKPMWFITSKEAPSSVDVLGDTNVQLHAPFTSALDGGKHVPEALP